MEPVGWVADFAGGMNLGGFFHKYKMWGSDSKQRRQIVFMGTPLLICSALTGQLVTHDRSPMLLRWIFCRDN